MVKPSGHCPHLGLKQNRAIRFASPTPEHRCYVTGEAQDIPVDQTTYCLSQGHVNCPLYMGLTPPSTSPYLKSVEAVPRGGLRGWLRGLSPRDRAIYTGLLGLLVVVIGFYITVGVRLLLNDHGIGGSNALPLPTQTAELVVATTSSVTSTPTSSPTPTLTATASATPSVTTTPSVTMTPTSTPSVTPRPIFIPPTAPPPVILPSPTVTPLSPTVTPLSPTVTPLSPTLTPTDVPDITFVPNTPEPRPTAQPVTRIPQ